MYSEEELALAWQEGVIRGWLSDRRPSMDTVTKTGYEEDTDKGLMHRAYRVTEREVYIPEEILMGNPYTDDPQSLGRVSEDDRDECS